MKKMLGILLVLVLLVSMAPVHAEDEREFVLPLGGDGLLVQHLDLAKTDAVAGC